MNTTDAAASPAQQPALSRREKEKLLQKMYFSPHWTAIIQLFGYRTLPMDEARQSIASIADKFGKEPVANACEALVVISADAQQTSARLKPHVRRMAFQILGPDPTGDAPTLPIAAPAPTESEAVAKPQQLSESKKAKEPRKTTKAVSPDRCLGILPQYRAAKERHPGMLLLFRMGDFYELFDDDAQVASKLLGLTLTTRDRTIDMAGFPHHQLEAYLQKLLQFGKRVAICEPVEQSLARGPIRREVTRVVTPGNTAECEPSRKGKPGKAKRSSTRTAGRSPRLRKPA
jgi:hypothetical protein